MCGRYYYDDYMWADIRDDFPELSDALPSMASGPAFGAPGDITPAMKAWSLAEGLRPGLPTWGFRGRGGKLIINARAETIAEKPAFAESVRERRCVLPAAGFYEWDGERRKVRFTLPDRQVLYLAGVWRPDGEDTRFVVITREANDSMRPVHDRMPLMIAPEDVRDWIARPERTEELLRQPLPELRAERDYEQLKWF
ncbi:MAG: SOS response-associated peptidase [Lachnospiraceae bacterium]|nr:SOS response-associated peptidase [Lachnospiraceae bacterium]